MNFRALFISAAVLIALGAAWSKRQSLQAWLAPSLPALKAIQFDNGTVRDYRPSSNASAQPQITPGGMRKCFKGQQISYTDMECPPGSTEKPVAGPHVNVLLSQAASRPNEPPTHDKARSSLRQSLDLTRDVNLKDRMMDRVIEGEK